MSPQQLLFYCKESWERLGNSWVSSVIYVDERLQQQKTLLHVRDIWLTRGSCKYWRVIINHILITSDFLTISCITGALQCSGGLVRPEIPSEMYRAELPHCTWPPTSATHPPPRRHEPRHLIPLHHTEGHFLHTFHWRITISWLWSNVIKKAMS